MDHLAEFIVPWVSPLIFPARQAMSTHVGYLTSTVQALMWLAKWVRPTATRTVSSLILRPNDVTGKAFKQAPDSLVEEASRRALECGSLASEIKESNLCYTLGWSQAFCW